MDERIKELYDIYGDFEIDDSINRMEHQLNDGYLDINTGDHDYVEIGVIKVALELFKEKYETVKESN